MIQLGSAILLAPLSQPLMPASQDIPPGDALPDETLARTARRDPTAFVELYRRHVQRVYAYHLARTGSVSDAQDLTSLTFVAALEGIATFRGEGSFAAWLMSIAHYKLVGHYRQRRPQVPLEAAAGLPHPDPAPEEEAEQRERFERVSRALNEISPERCEALVLRLFGGLSAAETARVLGKSQAAVKMLVHRGLGDLREILHSELPPYAGREPAQDPTRDLPEES